MYYKTVPFRVPRIFTVRNGSLKGNVVAFARSAGNRASYIWEYKHNNASGWIIAVTTVKAKYILQA